MTKQTRMTNDQKTCGTCSFELRASSFLRHSSFVLRHSSASSFSPCHHKHILEVRQVHRRRDSRLAVQFTHLETLDHPDEQARGKNAADAGSVNFRARLEVRLF